jgi:large subunit ribosomal protein L10
VEIEMPKPEKVQAVENLKAAFGTAKGIVLADYTGLTVDEANQLRRRCREAGVGYRVVKNTLARIAVKEAEIPGLEEYFDGMVAVAMSEEDSTAPARVLADFRREFQKLTFRGGYIEGRVFSSEQIREIAILPPREGLLARVIGAVNAPMGQIVWTLEGLLRDLITVIDQVSKQGEGSS